MAPSPKYERVINYIMDRIDSGEWPPGYRIPGIVALGKRLGVSQERSGLAVQHLVQDGVLFRVGYTTTVAKGEGGMGGPKDGRNRPDL